MRWTRALAKNFSISEWPIAKRTFMRLKPILQMTREHWRKQAMISSLALLLIPIGLINPYITSKIVDGPLMQRSVSQLFYYGAMMGVVTLGTLLIQNFITYHQNRFQTEVSDSMTRKVYVRLTEFSIEFFRGSNREKNANFLGSDGVEVSCWALTFVPQLLTNLLTVATRVAIVFFIDWRLGLTALLSPPFYLLKANFQARRGRLMAKLQRSTGMQYGKELRDSLGTIDVVKTFRTEDYHKERVFSALDKVTNLTKKNYRFDLFYNSFSGLMIKLLDSVPALVGLFLVATNQISLGQLSAALIYVGQAVGANVQLIELIPQVASRSVSVDAFTRFLNEKPTIVEPPEAVEVDFGKSDVRIENVSFSYIPQLPVLENLSFTIPAGRWTGIKAPSGYGKTTLLNLIIRLYDVQEGAIKIGGHDVRNIKFKCFSDQIAVVMQQMFFSRDTLRQTIAYDRRDASLEEVRTAAKMAGIDSFIMTLPKTYETQCGDAASRLSQGQRQRLQIARALIRKPKILIMDESFGSVDKETEDKIVAEMRSAFPHMTVIVVSHHQSVLDKMDGVVDLTKESRKIEAEMQGAFEVNYFDLGFHMGQEIDLALAELRSNPLVGKINVYGADANPFYYEKALQKYRDDGVVKFHFRHMAVASKAGRIKLYLHPNDLGHSIYPDKWLVTEEFIEVPAERFSAWYRSLPRPAARSFNILKANIEGAEWDLILDLDENGLFDRFDLFLGSLPGRFSDISKIRSLKESGAPEKALEILEKNGVHIQKLCHTRQEMADNVDVSRFLTRHAIKTQKESVLTGAGVV